VLASLGKALKAFGVMEGERMKKDQLTPNDDLEEEPGGKKTVAARTKDGDLGLHPVPQTPS
jgi:hypothetical protein